MVLPLPGIPTSTRLARSCQRPERISSVFSRGMALPKNRSSAAAACSTSMGSPPEQGRPSAWAWSNKFVRRGL